MTCTEFQERVVDLLDAAPKPATDLRDRALRDHIRVCGACAALYGELQKTLTALEPDVRLEASPLLKGRTLNKIDNLPPATGAKRNPWLRLWKPALAAAATLLIVFLVLHSRPGKPPVAFADVVRNLAVFRPYSHDEEVKIGDGKPMLFAHQFIMSPAIRRSEFPDGRVIIFDLATRDELYLWPDHKKATKHCYPNLPPASHLSIYEMVRINANLEFLGTKRMEGKKCSVFHSSDGTYTIWVDNQSQLPVRVEVIQLQDGRTVIESHFKFDIEIDPARFSLEPPADYDFSGTVTHEDKSRSRQDNDSRPFQPYSCLDEWRGEDGKTESSIRRYFLSRTIRRDETPDGCVVMQDLGTGSYLELWPHKRQAAKHVCRNYDPRGRVNASLDEMANLTSFGWGPENVGTKTIDGKNCTGFHATDFVNNDTTVWVDSQTNLPVRIEITQIKLKRTRIQSDFQVDIDTDPAQFSLEPPPDYKCEVVEYDFK